MVWAWFSVVTGLALSQPPPALVTTISEQVLRLRLGRLSLKRVYGAV